MRRIRVLLPAPLEPTNPVMPERSSSVTWLTPMTGPYHFETRWHNKSGVAVVAAVVVVGWAESSRPTGGRVVGLEDSAHPTAVSERSPRPGSAESSRSGIAGSLLPEPGPLRTRVADWQVRPAVFGGPGKLCRSATCCSTNQSVASAG